MEIVSSNFLRWKTLDFASAKLKEVGKFLNFGYRNRSRKEKCFLPHGRRNLGSIEYIKYWYQETTAKLLIGADYDFILSWERNMRRLLFPHHIISWKIDCAIFPVKVKWQNEGWALNIIYWILLRCKQTVWTILKKPI